jgi:hypothetical protein
VALRWATLREDLGAAGLEPRARVPIARFWSEQTLVLAVRR